MLRSKVVLFLIAVLMVGAVVLGTGFGAAATYVALNGIPVAPQALVQRVAHDLGVTAAPVTRAVVAPAAAPTVEPVSEPAATTASAPVTINIQPGADAQSQTLEAIYQKVNPSVVKIANLATSPQLGTQQALPQGEGSGFVWDTQGHIVTNDHVVSGADQLQVTFSDGTVVDATLVGTDPNGDVAVIKVDPSLATLVPVDLGDLSQVKVGQMAVAIGNPFGFEGTMTQGIVSAIGRSIPAVTGFSIPEAIQTDAAINPGNSGGPLLNSTGQVIGINDQIESQSGSSSGVGFAIPISIVKRIVPSLIDTGKYEHAYLGMQGTTYSPSWAQALDMPADARGAYVMGVVRGGPAASAGLRAGSTDTSIVLGADQTGVTYLQSGGDLITAVDGTTIKTMDDLLIYLEENTSPGQTVKLNVLRSGGAQATVTVTLGSRPDQTQTAG